MFVDRRAKILPRSKPRCLRELERLLVEGRFDEFISYREVLWNTSILRADCYPYRVYGVGARPLNNVQICDEYMCHEVDVMEELRSTLYLIRDIIDETEGGEGDLGRL